MSPEPVSTAAVPRRALVGGAGLADQAAGARDRDPQVDLGVAAEEAAAALGPDDRDPVAVLLDADLVGVLAGGDHLGGADLRGGDLDAAAAELDVQLDGGGGVEGAFHLCLQGVFVRRTSLLAARGAVLDRAC
jgi:hypothetical protein